MRPQHYKRLPSGVRCRGLCSWQELDPLTGRKEYWCCDGKGFKLAEPVQEPDYVGVPTTDTASIGGGSIRFIDSVRK